MPSQVSLPVRRWRPLVGALLLTSMLCAACGGGGASNGEQSKSANQVWTTAYAATDSVKSLHLVGTITDSGQTVTLDLNMSKAGNGGGTIGLNGDDLHLVVADGLVYMKASAKAWKAASGNNSLAKYAGKWVEAPVSGSPISNFVDFANSTKFLAELKPKGALKKQAGTTNWEGHRVVIISDSTKAAIYVSDTGTPYILHVQGGDTSSFGSMTFDDFGRAQPPAAPKGAISYTS